MPHVQTNGISMYYDEAGAGEPLLCLMGITAPGGVWELHTQDWSKAFRCVMPDNRGVGLTDKPPGPYTSRQMADDMAGLLDALGLDRVRVVGCSMGSTIAQQLAIHHADRVRSTVLMCPWARCDAYATAVFEHLQVIKARLTPSEFVGYIQTLIFTKPYFDDPANAQAMREARDAADTNPNPQPLHGLIGQARACIDHHTLDQLGRIGCPTLIIGGRDDIFTPRWMAEEIHERIAGSTLHLYPGAGHAFHWECLEDFNARVGAWLDAH